MFSLGFFRVDKRTQKLEKSKGRIILNGPAFEDVFFVAFG